MSRSLSATLTSQVLQQQMTEVFVALLTITHSDLSQDIYISSDPTETLSTGVLGTTSNSIEYVFFPFGLTLAEQTENLLVKAQVKIDNISRDIIQAVRTAQGDAPDFSIKFVLASDPDNVEFEITNLKLNNVRANAIEVTGDLEPENIRGEKYPKNTFNQADFPGVFGAPTSESA